MARFKLPNGVEIETCHPDETQIVLTQMGLSSEAAKAIPDSAVSDVETGKGGRPKRSDEERFERMMLVREIYDEEKMAGGSGIRQRLVGRRNRIARGATPDPECRVTIESVRSNEFLSARLLLAA